VDDVNIYTCTQKTLPTISINDVSVEEGDHGFNDAVFTVSLSHAYHQKVTVKYEVRPGTARPDSDYVTGGRHHNDRDGHKGDFDGKGHDGRDRDDHKGNVQTIEIEPLSISAPIKVRIRGDRRREADETFFVRLSKPKNAVIGDGSGTGTILNDDGPVTTMTTTSGGSKQ